MTLDSRFFELSPTLSGQVAATISAEHRSDERMIEDVAPLDEAKSGQLTFLLGSGKQAQEMDVKAFAHLGEAIVITTAAMAKLLPKGCTVMVCENPRIGFARALDGLVKDKTAHPVTGDGNGLGSSHRAWCCDGRTVPR